MAYSGSRTVNRITRSRHVLAGSLADQIWRYLRTAIIHGEIPPGTRLVELQLAQEMGTSQGPVREALQRLEQEGLVERRARSATIVTEVPDESIHDLIIVRALIERLAVQRAASKITEAQIDELRDLVQQMRECIQERDRLTLDDLNMEFHSRLCQWSGNPLLLRLWLLISAQMERLIMQRPTDHILDPYGSYVEGHIRIVEALATHDSDQAAQAVEKHIEDAWLQLKATEPEAVHSFTPIPTPRASEPSAEAKPPAG